MAIIRSSQLDLSSMTGSLFGTSSYAIQAATASYVLSSAPNSFIITGNVKAEVLPSSSIFQITSGSSNFLSVTNQGALTISSSADNIFLIKNTNNNPILTVSQSGVVVLATQSAELTDPAPNGGMYFTSSSFYVGLD